MYRRAIAAVAAIGLTAVALLGVAPAATADGHVGATYVALGDSEAAGTGNLPYIGPPECLRSKKAYPAVLAGWTGADHISAACSGATTGATTTQLVTLATMGEIGPATRLVTVTAGINNLEWQKLLQACMPDPASIACALAMNTAAQAGAALPVQIGTLVGQIRGAAPNALILVTGYPELFGQFDGTCSIGNWQGAQVRVSAPLAATADAMIGGVNSAIAAGVGGYSAQTGDGGVRFVDVVPAFTGHGLCDTGDRWIHGLAKGAPVIDRGLHPNTAGQQAFAGAIAAWLP